MITFAKTEKDLLDTIPEPVKNCWIHLSDPTNEEIERVSQITSLPSAMLKVALDAEEFAHIDIEEDVRMVVLDMPIIEKENNYNMFSTVPIGFLYNDDYFVSVCLKDSSIIKDILSNRIKGVDTAKKVRFMLQIIQRIEFKYLQYLKRIDKTSSAIQEELHKSVKNNELIDLMDIEKSLVYFATSLAGNDRVLLKVQKAPEITKYEDDLDLLDDVINDNKQAIEMCTIYRDILSGTMDAFASVISNNLNIIMKMLTLITIILSIPTLVASFWGMNVIVPFETATNGFWIVLGIAAVVATVASVILFRYSNMTMGRRKGRKK